MTSTLGYPTINAYGVDFTQLMQKVQQQLAEVGIDARARAATFVGLDRPVRATSSFPAHDVLYAPDYFGPAQYVSYFGLAEGAGGEERAAAASPDRSTTSRCELRREALATADERETQYDYREVSQMMTKNIIMPLVSPDLVLAYAANSRRAYSACCNLPSTRSTALTSDDSATLGGANRASLHRRSDPPDPDGLLGVVTVAFLVPRRPGRSVVQRARRQMENPEAVAAAEAKYGLDKPLIQQYFIYVGNLFRRCRHLFAPSNPWWTICSSPPGDHRAGRRGDGRGDHRRRGWVCLAARFHDRPPDHVARLFSLVGASAPVYWSGLVLLFIFSVRLGWLPGPGRIDTRGAAPPVRHRHVHDRFAARR